MEVCEIGVVGQNKKMWVVGNQNIPYAGQDTNAKIENYHANLKVTLCSSKGRFHGRRVSWAIHALVGDLLLHYWYSGLKKSNGFVLNRKHEQFVISVVLKAKMIPDSCVTLSTIGARVAH